MTANAASPVDEFAAPGRSERGTQKGDRVAGEKSTTASLRALEPSDDVRTIVLVVEGRITPGDVARLCHTARLILEECAAERIVCDVSSVNVDAATVDALARLRLLARRLGRRIRFRHGSPELRALLRLTGLDGVCRCEG